MLGGGKEGSKEEGRKVYSRRSSFKGHENSKSSSNLLNEQPRVQAMVSEGPNPVRRLQNSGFDAGSDDFSGVDRDGLKAGWSLKLENRVRVSVSKKSKHDVIELRRKLEGERDMVRSLMRKIEAGNEVQKNAPQGKEPDKAAVQPRMMKPLKQLSVSVQENSKVGMDNAEKEKRTPKANKLYRNSDFLLAKDKIPPAESNKKLKSNGKKGGGSGLGLDKFASQVFKSCSALLERLMKHKHAWVFNKPVDTVGLGLHDYFEIIRNPMDLGTVKDRLARNWYSSPLEFAEDVRLTFRNATMYNPKGQDVYVMAEQLVKIFEEKWALIQADHMREFKFNADFDVGSPLPTSWKAAPPQSQARRPDIKDATDMANHADKKRKKMASAKLGTAPIPKKPKARDPNKREMMYEEKQKLSIELQNLPSEKLESVVHIIKKRNPSVSQQDDEIEVDIDSVDTETLWELDRFITNYKKSLSKSNRKAEVVGQVVTVPEQNTKEKVISSVLTDNTKGNVTDEEKVVSPPAEIEEPGGNGQNQGASQSSSSSGSGSSSSGDPDGESSSADGSDGRHSSMI